MSFIQFESAREKERARQDLREVREHMLEEAKKRAVERAELKTKRILTGEADWMLPSVKEKLEEKNRKHKKDKKHKKSKKKLHKKRKHSSDDESESSDTTDSSDSDKKRKHKHSKKKKTKENKITTSTRYRDSASEDTHEDKHNLADFKKPEEPLKRDGWMTAPLILKTYSKDRVETKPKEQQIDLYDPAKNSRELNTYWKTTGTGLPEFQKPNDDENITKSKSSVFCQKSIVTKGWKKQDDKVRDNKCLRPERERSGTPADDACSSSDIESEKRVIKKPCISVSEFLTDQQMNELGAKILKAEITGNISLVEELREKLEKARTQRNIIKERQKTVYIEGKTKNFAKSEVNQDEHILLTHTDQLGNNRPLRTSEVLSAQSLIDLKGKHKRVNSHDGSGKRVRYFADDDRYDIKQMFEKEKYSSASEANLQFANIAGRHKNPNDDLEDIFVEKICQDNSKRSAEKDRNRAIREHKKMEAALDNCDKCFDSIKMQKELLICVGENVYLALPWYQGIQSGHCIIVPNQHVSCCTQIDEDIWTEINEFRKALTRMFTSQNKDVIFFEIANKLYRRPHLTIHCIPIRQSDGEMAPFYFKKAIEESEHEWSVNKQLVSLSNKSLRNSIPKGLPYFWVNFGMDTGFAHVIEDEERFPANFAQEIIGGMLNLDANKWRRKQKEQNIINKIKTFAHWWKKYDCTM